MTLELISLYNNPAVLYAAGIVLLGILVMRLWAETDRHYTKRAEEYWQTESKFGQSKQGEM